MHHRRLEPAPLALERYFGMKPLIAPILRTAREEPCCGRDTPSPAPAVAHEPLTDIVVERNEKIAGCGVGDRGADFSREFGRDALVRVDLQNPIAAAGVDARHAPRPFDLPGTFEDARAVAQSDRLRAVRAAVEDHDDLIGETQAIETFGELVFLVARHHER